MTKTKHHFIPTFHLALFTQCGTKGSTFWVFDQANGKQWEDIPKNVGYQKHFYRVNLPDKDPDIIENVLAYVENQVAPIIKKVCTDQKIPEEKEEYIWLINYIALLATRTPNQREAIMEPIQEIIKKMVQIILVSPERREAFRRKMEAVGIECNDQELQKGLKILSCGENHDISFDNNTHIKNMLTSMEGIISSLGSRNWTVVYSPTDVGDLICSDNPVSLNWIKEKERGFWSSPGYGLPGTQVSIPLSSRIMLLGRFEEVPENTIISSCQKLAILNSYTGMYSDRFIYSRTDDFLWFKKDKSIGNVNDFKGLIFGKGEADYDGC